MVHLRSLLRTGWLVLLAVSWVGATWAQCPMCKEAVVASEEGQRMAAGLNAGILYMLAAPYAIVAVIGLLTFWAYRRSGR